MKKTVFSLLLVLLLLAGLAVATGAAGDEPQEVPINVWSSGEHEIHPGQVGVIRYGWAACSSGLVRVFIAATNWEVTLVDAAGAEVLHLTPEDIGELWGEINIYEDPPPFAETCMGKGRPAWAEWRYTLTELEPGSYTLHTQWWLDHPLVDGADNDGDGKIDIFTPDIFDYSSLNIITFYSE